MTESSDQGQIWLWLFSGISLPHVAAKIIAHLDLVSIWAVQCAIPSAFKGFGKVKKSLAMEYNATQATEEDLLGMKTWKVLHWSHSNEIIDVLISGKTVAIDVVTSYGLETLFLDIESGAYLSRDFTSTALECYGEFIAR